MSVYSSASILDVEMVRRAEHHAVLSTDRSTKTGTVIAIGERVLASGYNRLPLGVREAEDRFLRPEKYIWTEHAECVAFGYCLRHGIKTEGATLYSNWWPCDECSRLCIEAGIVRVVGYKPDTTHPKYGHEFEASLTMLEEAGVIITFIGEREQVQK